ncbi:MAG: indolepyruvate ferredoxin oxidoreductase subunit alpha [Promethearchaeota archaeon]
MDVKYNLENLTKHVQGTGEFIRLDKDKCNGCGACTLVCVLNLWGIKNDMAFIREEYKEKCLECGSCYLVCAPGAIEFMYPAGGTGIVYERG